MLLSACGFQPLYGEKTQGVSTDELLELVAVPPIADRLGQLVRIELTNRLTPTRPAPTPAYRLMVELNESKASLAVRKDSAATRANLIITASYELTSLADGRALNSGSVRSVNSYDIVTSDFATLSAEQDARRRGAIDVADGIVDRLAIFLSDAERNAAARRTR